MRGTFKAHEVEIITGISVDTQKDWNKKIKAMDLAPMGEVNGHRVYSIIDVLFLELIQLLKARGLTVVNALSLVLEDTSERRREFEHPATYDIRQRLAAVFITHVLKFKTESDVMLYVPMIGMEQWVSTGYLSARTFPGSQRVVSADPEVTLEKALALRPLSDHALCINVSLMTRRFIEEYEQVGFDDLFGDLETAAAAIPASSGYSGV
ncbi:MAG: hypothetical protein ACK4M8_02740 [Allorhizobium sp.]